MVYSLQKKKSFKEIDSSKKNEKAGIRKLLKDRNLMSTVSMVKPFNRDIVLKFYANLKFNVFDMYALS